MALIDRADTNVSPAQWLRQTTAAVRVSFTWMGVRKTLTPEQKNQAAESFGAEGEFLSARKRLLDTKHVACKEVTAIRGKVVAYWKSLTLPFPESGIRLIRQHEIEGFNQQLTALRIELGDAVVRLDELTSNSRQRLSVDWERCTIPATIPCRYRACSMSSGISPMSSRPTTCSI